MHKLTVTLAALIAVAATPAAGAREREVQRAGGDKKVTVTGDQGRTATREVDRTAPGDKTVTTTGPNGNTVTREVDRTGADKSTTVTGPNGNTVTRDVDRSADGKSVTTTGAQGNSVTRETDRATLRERRAERRAAKQADAK